MTDQTVGVVQAGYEWRQRIEETSGAGLFPSDSAWRAQVRTSVEAPVALAELTTSNGGIVRIDDNTIEMVLPGSATVGLRGGSVVFDLVRTDVDPDRHIGFAFAADVRLPVTRSA